ncbi:MAG: hypothetical protein QNJ44_11255 [Rhodobacter sp.]|nr:hypothetical protein [Rhodobacter sp.]
MHPDVIWLIGAIMGVVTVFGGLLARDRWVMKTMRDGDDELHRRVNEVRDKYVRRDDLELQSSRFGGELHGLKDEIHQTNQRLDRLIELMIKGTAKGA